MAVKKDVLKQTNRGPNLRAEVRSISEPSAGKWMPGKSGNPAGRPPGSRQKISERLLADLAGVWETHGQLVLTRLAIDDPGKLATIAYGLLPRDVFISVEQRAPGGLDAESWSTLRRLLDIIAASGVEGDPQAVFGMIEDDLRARLATPIDTK